MQKRKKENIYHRTERHQWKQYCGVLHLPCYWFLHGIHSIYDEISYKCTWPRKQRDLITTVRVCGFFFVWVFFVVLVLFQTRKLTYSINLFQIVLMLAILSTGRKERESNSWRHLFPNVWLDMVQRVCSPILQEEVLSLNNINPLYVILHLLFSVETTFIVFTPQCFWATAAKSKEPKRCSQNATHINPLLWVVGSDSFSTFKISNCTYMLQVCKDTYFEADITTKLNLMRRNFCCCCRYIWTTFHMKSAKQIHAPPYLHYLHSSLALSWYCYNLLLYIDGFFLLPLDQASVFRAKDFWTLAVPKYDLETLPSVASISSHWGEPIDPGHCVQIIKSHTHCFLIFLTFWTIVVWA